MFCNCFLVVNTVSQAFCLPTFFSLLDYLFVCLPVCPSDCLILYSLLHLSSSTGLSYPAFVSNGLSLNIYSMKKCSKTLHLFLNGTVGKRSSHDFHDFWSFVSNFLIYGDGIHKFCKSKNKKWQCRVVKVNQFSHSSACCALFMIISTQF